MDKGAQSEPRLPAALGQSCGGWSGAPRGVSWDPAAGQLPSPEAQLGALLELRCHWSGWCPLEAVLGTWLGPPWSLLDTAWRWEGLWEGLWGGHSRMTGADQPLLLRVCQWPAQSWSERSLLVGGDFASVTPRKCALWGGAQAQSA